MSDTRIDGARRMATRDGNEEDTSRTDTPTDRASADRDAAARLDAWSDGDRGMTSAKGASMLSPVAPLSQGPTKNEIVAAWTAKIDRPLEHDTIGNMLPGLFVGGMANVMEGLLGEGLGIAMTSAHVAEHAALEIGADVVLHEAPHAAAAVAGSLVAEDLPATPEPTTSTAPSEAGRTSPRGACEPAPSTNESRERSPEGPAFRDRVPYAPGKAPVRVPEAPLSIRG